MKTQAKDHLGKGYMLGALIGISAGILTFIFTKMFVLALSMALPLTLSIGIGLEEKFNEGHTVKSKVFRKTVWNLFITGILVFTGFLLYFILH